MSTWDSDTSSQAPFKLPIDHFISGSPPHTTCTFAQASCSTYSAQKVRTIRLSPIKLTFTRFLSKQHLHTTALILGLYSLLFSFYSHSHFRAQFICCTRLPCQYSSLTSLFYTLVIFSRSTACMHVTTHCHVLRQMNASSFVHV